MDMACGGGGEVRRELASELEQLRAMARELEAHVGRGSPAATELCGALASSVDKVIVRLADSPRGGGGHGNAATGQSKKRKGVVQVRRQVRVRSVQDAASLDDGLSWRKYGQKDILGAKYPRAYFRCTHRQTQGCSATKQVQRADGDPLLFDVVYLGEHTCAARQPAAAQEQSSPPAAGTSIQWLDLTAPFWLPSSPAGTGSGGFNGGFPLASPARPERQVGGGYSFDFDAQLDEWFLNPSEFLQPEIHNL